MIEIVCVIFQGTVIEIVVEARDMGPVKPLDDWRRVTLYLRVFRVPGIVPVWTLLNPNVVVTENTPLNTPISRVILLSQ